MPKIIYRITNTLNNDFYIGKTERDLDRRFREHQTISLRNSQTHLHRAMRKYGIDAFKCELVESVIEADIAARERFWIETLKPHYNMTDGGEGSSGRITSNETKAKIAASLLGKPLSQETKTKISASNKGKIRSSEAKRNYSKSQVGRTFSETTRHKMSKAAKTRAMPYCTKEDQVTFAKFFTKAS